MACAAGDGRYGACRQFLEIREMPGVSSLWFGVLVPLGGLEIIMESLILAQNERWRRVLSMQVVRQGEGLPSPQSGGLVSNTWVTHLLDGDSR